jgi:hypothetical protein
MSWAWIVDTGKYLFEHQGTALILAFVVLTLAVMFWKPISLLLSNYKSKGGGEATPNAESQKFATEKPSVMELTKEFDSFVQQNQEEQIRKALETRNLPDERTKIDYLIKLLATAQSSLFFEYVNFTIWQSQINILERGNFRRYVNASQAKYPLG